MYEETKRSKVVKYILIGIALLFVFVMLVLPLVTVICEAFKSGAEVFWQAVSDDYTVKAIVLTVEATVFAVLFNTVFGIFAAWSITKFRFKGKKLLTTLIDLPVTVSPIIAGLIFVLTFGRQSPIYPLLSELGIKVIFAVPGIILATVFVTFPFISRELIPVLESEVSVKYNRGGFTDEKRKCRKWWGSSGLESSAGVCIHCIQLAVRRRFCVRLHTLDLFFPEHRILRYASGGDTALLLPADASCGGGDQLLYYLFLHEIRHGFQNL